MHTAQQDAVPFLLLVGQVASRDLRRDAFQEIDYRQMFGSIAKWVIEISDPARVSESLLRALRTATTGTPGPVVIVLPEDVLMAASGTGPALPQPIVRSAAAAADVATLRQWLATATRPVVLAGSAIQGQAEALHRFAQAWSLPTLTSFRRQDLFDNTSPHFAGAMQLANPARQMALLAEADLVLVLGARMSDITTQGYAFPAPGQRLAHAHPDPAAIGTHFPTDLPLACDPVALLNQLGSPDAPIERAAWIARLHAEQQRQAAPATATATDGVVFERVVDIVGATLPATGILTLDAGTFAAAAYRIIPFRPPQRLLAPIAGAMGFGIPAAVAAALRCPDRVVVAMVGDGGFLMTGNELAVALERGLALKVIVSDNRSYGSIRINQERAYPGRPIGTGLTNPDFELIGRAFGLPTTHIRDEAGLAALPGLLTAPGPAFIVVDSSLEAVLPA